ncbi:Retrovirus-related Pol polyprotein from transposon 17.6, partial [Mucuna pruriens]
MWLQSGKELPQSDAPQPSPGLAEVETEPGADSRSQQEDLRMMNTCSNYSGRWRLIFHFLTPYNKFPDTLSSSRNSTEQEEKLLEVLRRHKKAIGWTLTNLPWINPSICMHKILFEEDALSQRLNPTLLDVVKKEVTKLLAVGIIYPISDSQWVSPIQVVPKKSRMTVIKNWQDEMLNQATRKDHFPLLFVDQVLEKLVGYMQIHIALVDQHKTTFTCLFGTFAYTRMLFRLCSAPNTFQRCMISIFSDLLEDYMEVFMDDFMVYAESFEACLDNLSRVLRRCVDSNLVLNFEKCHFMVTKGIILGHLVLARGIELDKAKINAIFSLPNPASLREVRSFLGHEGFYRQFIKDFSKIALTLSKLLQKDADFVFNQPYVDAFQELKRRLTFTPILKAPNWVLQLHARSSPRPTSW